MVQLDPVPTMTWPQVCARRLARHGLTEPVPVSRLVDQVRVMGGAHAQVMAAAELSIGLRVADTTRSTVQDALWSERTLVKTYGPRGTVHLLPAADLGRWTAALSALPALPGGQPPAVRLSPERTDQVVAALAAAVADADLTLDELDEAVVAATGPWAGERVMPAFSGAWPRWRQTLRAAAHRGAICFGANRGRRVTYASPSRWLGEVAAVDSDEALAWLVRTYLHAFGPATPAHLAQFLAAPRPWAAQLFASLGDGLQPVEVEGTTMWGLAGDELVEEERPGGVRLLPYFDNYVVGSHPRPSVFPGVAADRALAGGQAGPVAVLVVDGVVAGVWHQRRVAKQIVVTVEPFGRLEARQQRQLEAQAGRVGQVLGVRAELVMGPVTVGRHL